MTRAAKAPASIEESWTEKEFQSHVIRLARSLGWGISERAWRTEQEEAQRWGLESPLTGLIYHTRFSMGSESGWPDLVLIRKKDQRVMFRELKTAKGRISDRQVAVIRLLQEVGLDAAVWRPQDLDRIGRELL